MISSFLIPALVVVYLDGVCMDRWKLWWRPCTAAAQTFDVETRMYLSPRLRVLSHRDVCAPRRSASVTCKFGASPRSFPFPRENSAFCAILGLLLALQLREQKPCFWLTMPFPARHLPCLLFWTFSWGLSSKAKPLFCRLEHKFVMFAGFVKIPSFVGRG